MKITLVTGVGEPQEGDWTEEELRQKALEAKTSTDVYCIEEVQKYLGTWFPSDPERNLVHSPWRN